MKLIDNISLADFIPDNLKLDKEISALIPPLDSQLQDVSRLITNASLYPRIDSLNEPELDLLAKQFHADFYDLAATLTMKRDNVKNALLWHMHKGTSWAIIEALRQLGINAQFLHWHDTGDPPYTFRIKAEITGDYYRTQGRDKIIQSIIKAVNDSKSARSLFLGLDTSIHFNENIGLFTAQIPFLSGNQLIHIAPPDLPYQLAVFTGTCEILEGYHVVENIRTQSQNIFVKHAQALYESRSIDISMEDNILHELLRLFEQRIMNALELNTHKIFNKLEQDKAEINAHLERVEKLLLWQDNDDE